MYRWEEKRTCKQYSTRKIEDLRLYREKLREKLTESKTFLLIYKKEGHLLNIPRKSELYSKKNQRNSFAI